MFDTNPAARSVTLRDGRHVTLRPAMASDAPALMALWRAVRRHGDGGTRDQAEFDALGQAYAERSLAAPPGSLRIMADPGDGAVVGEIVLWREMGERLRHGATLGISVHPEWQGIGLGRRLMSAALDWARTEKAAPRRVELRVLADNARARSLYAAFGFTVEGVRRQAVRLPDGSYVDEVLMAVLLPATESPEPSPGG
jgi:RimJ/RimL family protein N-acetyltransferase